MDPALLVVLLIVGVGVALAVGHVQKTEWNRAVAAWAAERGVDVVPSSWSGASGEIDGVHVAIESFLKRSGKTSLRYTRLEVATELPGNTTLASETTFRSSVGRMLKGDDMRTGDDVFDSAILLRGDETELLARMNQPARELALAVVQSEAELSDGRFVLEMRGTRDALAALDASVDTLVAFAKAVRLNGPVVAHLAANAKGDPDAGVRARNLRELVDVYGSARETADAIAAGLGDRAAMVRLEAALAKPGPAADAALEALVADETLDAALRVKAARTLAERRPQSPALADAQAWLVQQLNEPVPEDAAEAAEALGAFAGIEVIESLLPHTRGLLKAIAMKDAATRAIAAIQARAGGVAGALSVVDTRAGAGALSQVADTVSESVADEVVPG
jgi:hypothetical protein